MLICLVHASAALTYEELTEALKTTSDNNTLHRLRAQTAEAGIQRLENEDLSATARKKLKAEIHAHCADVQLGTMDLWYGSSVVSWGRLMLLEGKWKEVRSALLDQAEVLQNIEKNLAANTIPVSSISPVAGCRYMLGETYRLEYEEFQTLEPAAQALKHFYNVYIKYGDSPWGEKAQEKAEAAQCFLENNGRQVRIELGPHKEAFVANKFKLGVRLMTEERYADAIGPIETAINYFPETGKSVEALRNLAFCHFKLEQDDQARMVAEYLCERFSSDTNAPAALLGLGRKAISAGCEEFGEGLFTLYLQTFPEHENRSGILSYFAWKAYKAEDWERAALFFQSLEIVLRSNGATGPELQKAVFIQATHPLSAEKLEAFMLEFPESEWAAPALNKKAQALLVKGDFDGAFQTLEKLKRNYPDTSVSKNALAGLIVAAVDAARFDIAEQVLEHMLEDEESYGPDIYLTTGEGLLSAKQFILAEKAFLAVPQNERALFGTASCRFGLNDFESSFQTLEKLLNQFPGIGKFYDARLMQARCLVQLNRIDEACTAYAEASNGQDYAVNFEMANVLIEPEARLAAYQRIALLADPDISANRPLIAESIVASLPLGIELKKYDLVLAGCDQFEALFPQHGQLPTIGTFRKEAERALAQ
ncbi:CDC27 family protein [Pontiellaceae bacterium B12227]|nr:CDC27 family protein [Pontiellaceae bacterium B12227]